MGVSVVDSFFSGLKDAFSLFSDMFSMLPVVLQVLIIFGFGLILFICIVQMFRDK